MSDTSYMVHDYPDQPEYDEYVCEDCGEPIEDDDVFSVSCMMVCEDCFWKYIKDNYTAVELARDLDIEYGKMEDFYG